MYWSIKATAICLALSLVTKAIRYEAEDAILSGNYVIINCPGGNKCSCSGNKMVNKIGKHNVLTFSVPVNQEGIYDIDVGYMTTNQRSVTVTVNSDQTTSNTHSFTASSNYWCYQSGSSLSSKTIQVNLQSGTNLITFDNNANWAPIIDYIDVPQHPNDNGGNGGNGGNSNEESPYVLVDGHKKYEAESAILNGDYVLVNCASSGCSCSGNKMVNKIGKEGDNIADAIFNVNVQEEGNYKVKIEYLTNFDRQMDITVNNVHLSKPTFLRSGSWCYLNGATNTQIIDINLNSGLNSIKLSNNNGQAPIIDYIKVPLQPHDGGNNNNDNYEFKYTPQQSGIHYMKVIYSSSSDVMVEIFINNEISESLLLPNTNSKQSSYSIHINLPNNNNEHSIKFNPIGNNLNEINNIEINKQNLKKGLIFGGLTTSEDFAHFKEYIGWYYRYNPVEPEAGRDYARANNIEYVPMIGYPRIKRANGVKCRLIPKDIPSDFEVIEDELCTYQEIFDMVASNDMDRVRYLMGNNEPWNTDDGGFCNAKQAVYMWNNYIVPIGQELNLKLISPNVKAGSIGIDWFESFLKECVDDNICDVNNIDVIAVHEYKCQESYYNKNYDETKTSGTFYSDLINAMGSYGGINWSKWVHSKPVWVTETNCFWEQTNPNPSNQKQCESVSYQRSGSHGIGSLQWFDKNSRIERYAWWTTVNLNPTKTQLLIDADTRKLNPTGYAYQNPISSTNCNIN